VWLAGACVSPYLPNAEQDAESGCQQGGDALALVCSATQACAPYTSTSERIRIVDWNIKAGRQRGLDAVIDTLLALDPDVVLLQEVDRDSARTGHIDQPETIARSLGDDFEYVFAPTLELEGGTYGIAMLTRLPVRSASKIPLSNLYSSEPRTAIDARLCAGPGELRVVNHHADVNKESAANSCLEILAHMLQSSNGQSLFAGDLNQLPAAPGPTAIVEAGLHDVLAKRDPSGTFGDARIDFMFVDPQLTERVVDARVIQTDASDHELLLMDLFAGYSAPPTISHWRLPN
jgi:endonuclease/exonuclease/phosphatase family metal-dependent hydrolase